MPSSRANISILKFHFLNQAAIYSQISIFLIFQQFRMKPISQAKQDFEEVDAQSGNESHLERKSQFTEEYRKLTKTIPLDWEELERTLYRQGITYNPNCPFEAFSYEVEMGIASIDYLKIHIKIAHFSLTIKVLIHHQANPLQYQHNSSGMFGSIYFAILRQKSICLKTFPYDNEDKFHTIFPRIIKELTIQKICSAVGSAPSLKNYLGFDLIILADCVMYAMQKGEPVGDLTKQTAGMLKKQLWLMHQLKIVHCDIKPENIVVSPDLKRPVFIDFGLSEIIQEPFGFKTSFTFRGTPTSCSPQMLDILGGGRAYIDLYYNDAFALSFSISQVSFMPEIQVYDQYSNNPTDILYLFTFKYHYLERNEAQAADELNQFIKYNGNIKSVLIFIKKVLRFIFISSIFYDKLKKFSKMAEYLEIEQRIKNRSEKFMDCLSNILTSALDRQNSQEMSNMVLPISYKSIERQNFLPFQGIRSYTNAILEADQLNTQNITQFMAMALECIRFDMGNHVFQDKIVIARKMNRLFRAYKNKKQQNQTKIKDEKETDKGLNDIKILIINIIEECLSSVPTKWSKDNLFNVVQQAILIDINLSEYIEPLFSFFDSSFQGPLEKVFVILQCLKLRDSLQLILSDDFESKQILTSKLNEFLDRSYSKFMERSFQANQLEMITIQKMMRYLQADKFSKDIKILLEDFQKQLQIVKDVKIRKYLLFAFINIKIKHLLNSSQCESMNLAKSIKQQINAFSLDFFSCIKATLAMISVTCSYSDFQLFRAYVSKIINCEAVFKKIRLYRWREEIFSVCTVFTQNINKFVEIYPHICSISKSNVFKIHDIVLESVRNKTAMVQPLRSQLFLLYCTYSKFCPSVLDGNGKVIEQYYRFFPQFQIESSFYQFHPSTQSLFLSRIPILEDQIARILKQAPDEVHKIMLLLFKKNLYSQELYIFQNKYLDALRCIQTLIQSCRALHNTNLIFYFIKRAIVVSNMIGEQSFVIGSSIFLLNYCQEIDYYAYYFMPANQNNTFSLFVVLARHKPSMLHKILNKFMDILLQHPVESYFATLLSALNCFIKSDPSHSHILHYSNFTSSSSLIPSNPYLLIFHAYSLQNEPPSTQLRMLKVIVASIDSLVYFVRKIILEKYFAIFLQLTRQESLTRKIGVFRMAKAFFSSQKARTQAKQLFVVGGAAKGTKIADFGKVKVKKYIKNIS